MSDMVLRRSIAGCSNSAGPGALGNFDRLEFGKSEPWRLWGIQPPHSAGAIRDLQGLDSPVGGLHRPYVSCSRRKGQRLLTAVLICMLSEGHICTPELCSAMYCNQTVCDAWLSGLPLNHILITWSSEMAPRLDSASADRSFVR